MGGLPDPLSTLLPSSWQKWLWIGFLFYTYIIYHLRHFELLLLVLSPHIHKYKRKGQCNESKFRTLHGCGDIKRQLFTYQLLGIGLVCCIVLKCGFTTSAWWQVSFPPSLCDLWFVSVCLLACEGLTRNSHFVREGKTSSVNIKNPFLGDGRSHRKTLHERMTDSNVCARCTVGQPCEILSQIELYI